MLSSRNIAATLKDIRETRDFTDVILACQGGQVEAHKIVVSSCSDLLKEIIRNNPHSKPLIYLKDVNIGELEDIVRYMYYGEVRVKHTDLNRFLQMAQDLQV